MLNRYSYSRKCTPSFYVVIHGSMAGKHWTTYKTIFKNCKQRLSHGFDQFSSVERYDLLMTQKVYETRKCVCCRRHKGVTWLRDTTHWPLPRRQTAVRTTNITVRYSKTYEHNDAIIIHTFTDIEYKKIKTLNKRNSFNT